MKKYTLEEYNLAKNIIKNAIAKIMREKCIKLSNKVQTAVDISDKEEVKMVTEMQIILPLVCGPSEEQPQISEQINNEIELVMRLFDAVYDEAYKECIFNQIEDKQFEEYKKESVQNLKIEPKAEKVNAFIRSQTSKMHTEYLDTKRQEAKVMVSSKKITELIKKMNESSKINTRQLIRDIKKEALNKVQEQAQHYSSFKIINLDEKENLNVRQRGSKSEEGKIKKLKFNPISNGEMGPEQEIEWDR